MVYSVICEMFAGYELGVIVVVVTQPRCGHDIDIDDDDYGDGDMEIQQQWEIGARATSLVWNYQRR